MSRYNQSSLAIKLLIRALHGSSDQTRILEPSGSFAISSISSVFLFGGLCFEEEQNGGDRGGNAL